MFNDIFEVAGNIALGGKTSQVPIEPCHIFEAISKNKDLSFLFSSSVFAETPVNDQNSGGWRYSQIFLMLVWGFCFENGVKLHSGVEEMLFRISSNFVTCIVENLIPFLVAYEVSFSRQFK
jgi:hypothetical protein